MLRREKMGSEGKTKWKFCLSPFRQNLLNHFSRQTS